MPSSSRKPWSRCGTWSGPGWEGEGGVRYEFGESQRCALYCVLGQGDRVHMPFLLLCRFLFILDINIYYMYITLNITFPGNCNHFFLNHKRNKWCRSCISVSCWSGCWWVFHVNNLEGPAERSLTYRILTICTAEECHGLRSGSVNSPSTLFLRLLEIRRAVDITGRDRFRNHARQIPCALLNSPNWSRTFFPPHFLYI